MVMIATVAVPTAGPAPVATAAPRAENSRAGAQRADAQRAAADCVAGKRNAVALRGVQRDRYTTDMPADGAVDAQTAMWLQVDNWPVSFSGGSGACWLGGQLFGTYPQDTTWDEFHHTGALNFQNADMTIVDLRIHNFGDGIRAREGARNFLITGAHLSFMHDDCIENDQLYSGTVEHSFLDGCYVAFSARSSSSDDELDGRTETFTIQDNVVRLQGMPTVYKGKTPGHGGFFKWDDNGVSPKLVVRNNVFRVDSKPNHQDLGLPRGYDVKCSNNVVVWRGKGRYPDRLPKCFTVTRDLGVWRTAVAQWRAAHPATP